MRLIYILILLVVGGVASATPPNVLFLCIDDLKPALRCYGDPHAQTPNIDRLAARGVRFDRAYCNQAVCAPSRNSLFTGMRPQTIGVYDLQTNFRKAAPEAVTLPQQFKKHGYFTVGLGKHFHVGHGNFDDAESWSVPSRLNPTIRYHLPANRARKQEEASPQATDTKRKGAAMESADVEDTGYSDGVLAEEAIEQLRQLANEPGKPFFLAVGFRSPHLPFTSPKKYWDLYDREQFTLPEYRTSPAGAPKFAPTTSGELLSYKGIPKDRPISAEMQQELIHGYYAAVSYVDAQVGKVLDALDEVRLADGTVVVLWGDHGWHLGDHGMWCKHTNYEQATRIPLIFAGPGVGSGVVKNSFVETVDIYPTLCQLANVSAPERIDGRSFRTAILDTHASARDHVTHVYPRGKRIGQAIRTDRYRLVEWKIPSKSDDTAEYELYDYQEDPLETRNMAAERPETVAELKTLLDALPEPKPQFRLAE
jgi:iduronate 2-sulfatase